MKVLSELISSLDTNAPLRDIRQGIFHTGVLSRHCGLASTLPRDALKEHPLFSPLVQDAGFLLDKGTKDLCHLALSDSLAEAAIGMATINSLLEVEEKYCLEINAGELIAERGSGKRIAIVGHFPFVPKLREIAKKLWVIEKNPQAGDYSEENAAQFVPQAEIVAITGASLTNHTFDSLISLCDPQAFVVLLGDSTPLSPLLFDFGVSAVAGTLVIDPDLALKCISQGATFRQIKGKRLLTLVR